MPYARRGVLWDAHRRYYGQEGDVLVWQAPTRAMNPAVPEALIAAAYAEDEAAASVEYGAQFRRDLEAFVAGEALEARVVAGRHELPPIVGIDYVAFVDPSGGWQDKHDAPSPTPRGRRNRSGSCSTPCASYDRRSRRMPSSATSRRS